MQTLLEAQTRVTGVAAVADGLVTRGDMHNFFIVIVYRCIANQRVKGNDAAASVILQSPE